MVHLPEALATTDPRVVRPAQLRDVYANPAKELARLTEAGALLHLAHGYYAIVPERYRNTGWRPPMEGVGLAIAQRDHGPDDVALMGPSAARLIDALPRALGVAIVASAKQRPVVHTSVGPIRFVTRDVQRLDIQRAELDLATGWATTAEQTMLDLADRPDLGGLPRPDVAEAIRTLGDRIDWELVATLAQEQRKRPAAVRAAWIVGVEPPVRTKRPVAREGFTGAAGADLDAYGIS